MTDELNNYISIVDNIMLFPTFFLMEEGLKDFIHRKQISDANNDKAKEETVHRGLQISDGFM